MHDVFDEDPMVEAPGNGAVADASGHTGVGYHLLRPGVRPALGGGSPLPPHSGDTGPYGAGVNLSSLTGEANDDTLTTAQPDLGCGNGMVSSSELPVELQDLLALHSGWHPSVSGIGLWTLLERANVVLPDDDGVIGAVTCPTTE